MESFGQNIKRAFKWHWNLLALGGGAVFALLSGHADIFIPMVLAAEMGYLAFLGTNLRFQNVLRGKKLLENRDEKMLEEVSKKKREFEGYLNFLNRDDRERFEAVCERSRKMTELQRNMRTQTSEIGDTGFKTQSLEKMIWLFLKLLHHKVGLEKFLDATSESGLELQIRDTTGELKESREKGAADRLISSLEEKLNTIKSRLANYREAENNFKILGAEIDKTEQQINHICEVGMTSRDSSSLSRQVDGVADSIRLSEEALHDLDLGGIFDDSSDPPPLISDDLLEYE